MQNNEQYKEKVKKEVNEIKEFLNQAKKAMEKQFKLNEGVLIKSFSDQPMMTLSSQAIEYKPVIFETAPSVSLKESKDQEGHHKRGRDGKKGKKHWGKRHKKRRDGDSENWHHKKCNNKEFTDLPKGSNAAIQYSASNLGKSQRLNTYPRRNTSTFIIFAIVFGVVGSVLVLIFLVYCCCKCCCMKKKLLTPAIPSINKTSVSSTGKVSQTSSSVAKAAPSSSTSKVVNNVKTSVNTNNMSHLKTSSNDFPKLSEPLLNPYPKFDELAEEQEHELTCPLHSAQANQEIRRRVPVEKPFILLDKDGRCIYKDLEKSDYRDIHC